MDIEQTNKMLALYTEYWPAFDTNDARVFAWAEALQDYGREEAWKATLDFRSEEKRTFAPTISELIGRMNYYRERAISEYMDNQLLLEGPKSFVGDPIESYTYKTWRTTPKKKQDETDFEVRKALRCSRERKKEIHEAMMREGFKKEIFSLGDKKGYRYVRV